MVEKKRPLGLWTETVEDSMKRADCVSRETSYSGVMLHNKDLRRVVLMVSEYRELTAEVERQQADIAYLLDRARSAGSWGGCTPRDHGTSSNAIVTYAYGGVVPSASYMPCDKADLAACYLAVERMPKHRKTPEVMEALERARRSVTAR